MTRLRSRDLSTIGGRLRGERERLRFSQAAFAAPAKASKGSQLNWEQDTTSPTAAVLAAFAEAGADVAYIITGAHCGAAQASRAPMEPQPCPAPLARQALLEPSARRSLLLSLLIDELSA